MSPGTRGRGRGVQGPEEEVGESRAGTTRGRGGGVQGPEEEVGVSRDQRKRWVDPETRGGRIQGPEEDGLGGSRDHQKRAWVDQRTRGRDGGSDHCERWVDPSEDMEIR